jgi:hypothetical protein
MAPIIRKAGYVRPGPDGFTGIVRSVDGGSGDVLVEAPDRKRGGDHALMAARNLGWDPPYSWRDDPGGGGAEDLYAADGRLGATEIRCAEIVTIAGDRDRCAGSVVFANTSGTEIQMCDECGKSWQRTFADGVEQVVAAVSDPGR